MSDDLTRLTDEERDSLLAWVSFDTDEGEAGFLEEVESLFAAHTAVLIERAERAEREYAEAAFAVTQLAALRAAVTGLADETGSAFPYVQVRELRALLVEGDSHAPR